jgi:hypothetical protein
MILLMRKGSNTNPPTRQLMIAIFMAPALLLINRKSGKSKAGKPFSLIVGKKKEIQTTNINASC